MKQPYIANKYNRQEERDIENFRVFMDYFTKNYHITAATESGCWFDICSSNETGGTIITELKGRNSSVEKYDSIMIEPEKLNKLIGAWKDKQIWSFYANIVEGKEIMYVFFIPGICHMADKWKMKKKMKIPFDFNGQREYKYEDRVFIPKDIGYRVDFSQGEPIVTDPVSNISVLPPKAYDIDFTREITAKDLGL